MANYDYRIGDGEFQQTSNENGLFDVAIEAARSTGDESEVNYVAGGVGNGLYRSKNGTLSKRHKSSFHKISDSILSHNPSSDSIQMQLWIKLFGGKDESRLLRKRQRTTKVFSAMVTCEQH